MGRRPGAFVLIVLAAFLAAFLLYGCSKSRDMSGLSDLGGVYLSDLQEIDFNVELTGKLTEGEAINAVLIGDGEVLETSSGEEGWNRTKSWGLKRNSGNQPPDPDPGAPELLKKYNSIYIGDTSRKVIYLTFDEGYENGYTGKILDVLKENKAKAAFFITGPYLKQNQELVRRMVEEGHIVGNHTIHHPSLPSLDDRQVEEEVLGLDRAFYEKFGKHMKYLRPPKGEYSERTLAITSKLGYINVFWSFAYDDWYRDKIRGPQYAYDVVMKNLHNGAILLLHAVSKDNADALDKIIKDVKQQGYIIGTLDDIS